MAYYSRLVMRVAATALLCAAAISDASAAGFLGAWTGDPAGSTGVIPSGTQTLREIISPRVSGTMLRLTLTNRLGTLPVTFNQVWIGTQKYGAYVVKGTNKQLSFSNSPSVTIAAGASVTSDPLPFPVVSYQKLAISMQGDRRHDSRGVRDAFGIARNQLFLAHWGTAAATTGLLYEPFELTEGGAVPGIVALHQRARRLQHRNGAPRRGRLRGLDHRRTTGQRGRREHLRRRDQEPRAGAAFRGLLSKRR